MTRVPDLSQFIPEKFWYCPNCPAEDKTREAQPHTRYHNCPGLRGLSSPMVEKGTQVRITVHEPEDYIGQRIGEGESVPTDQNGRPVAAVVTEHADGSNDVAVFAGCVSPSGMVTS